MKKIIVLSFIVIFSSCKKEYTCYCHSAYPLDEREGFVIKSSYFQARKKCKNNEQPYEGYDTKCKLK